MGTRLKSRVTFTEFRQRRFCVRSIDSNAHNLQARIPMESPFAQHLNTNYAPSDFEVKGIQSHLIPYVDEISRLDSLIRDLSAQREKTLQYIVAHKALLSPARRLPPDVMQELFLACLPTHRNAVMSITEAPILLTRICSAWRALALSTPALWASLHIPLELILDYGKARRQPRTWLERSGRCPLSLSIVGARTMEHWEEFESDQVDLVMEALAGSADRWRSLDLHFRAYDGMLRLAQMYAPRLAAVRMEGNSAEIVQMKFLTTPSLRTVELNIRGDFDRWIPQMPLYWSHLTSLKIEAIKFNSGGPKEGLSPPVALEILKRCPQLIHFESDLIAFQHDLPPVSSEPTVSLPTLREFVVCRCNWSVRPASVDYLFQHLLMPQLRRLQLPRRTLPNHAMPFPGDLAARSPLIQELSIDLAGLANDCLAETLLNLPSLKKLVLTDRDSGPVLPGEATPQQLLTFLAPTTTPAHICPILEELHIIDCREKPWDEELLDFARRRLDYGNGHFRRLHVGYKSFMPPIGAEVLAPFVARGLTISTTSTPSNHVLPPQPTPWTGVENLEE
ncbi:hypothetical protein DFH07DRAFT_896211 [Mycena maculata]|uniref:F-box domain-containing protein n=1 Tax=Mycena maculata TaxID=230809 RepID=A0AAD7HST8_9AGAR|nr:hypothetical protein DFH07DRAFT_896211 [Mycena maculata]